MPRQKKINSKEENTESEPTKQCPFCSMLLAREYNLKQHIKSQHSKDLGNDPLPRYVCTIFACRKEYSNMGNLRVHFKKHHLGQKLDETKVEMVPPTSQQKLVSDKRPDSTSSITTPEMRGFLPSNHSESSGVDWLDKCRQLLDSIWNNEDSELFKEPVNTVENPCKEIGFFD